LDKQPQVSVVIPTFRRRETLQRALESVQAQTCPAAEIIVVDDCSGPDYDSFFDSLPSSVRVVRLPENRGPSAARNAGAALAQSPFVALLDSDDWWIPTKLERQCAYLRENPDAHAVHTAVLIAVGDQLRRATCRKPLRLNARSILTRRAVITSSLLVRKDTLAAVGGFDEFVQSSEDYDLCVRLVANGAHVDFVPEYLTVLRRERQDHISSNWRRVLKGQWQVAWKHRCLLVQEFGWTGFLAKLVTDAHHAAYKGRSPGARALRLSLTPFVSSMFGDPAEPELNDGLWPVERSG
jgi:glycosyltransferase involved in cell wall biosynthesis